MARRFVSSTGSNTSPYDTWAKAATLLQTAITGSVSGDEIILDVGGVPSADSEAASTNWQLVNNTSLICSTRSGTDTVTRTPMAWSAWLGNSGTGTFRIRGVGYVYGVTLRQGGSGALGFGDQDGDSLELEDCRMWGSATGANPTFNFGGGLNNFVRTINLIVRGDRTSNTPTLNNMGRIIHRNISFDFQTNAAFELFRQIGTNGILDVQVFDSDLSVGLPAGCTLAGGSQRGSSQWLFARCKLPTSYIRHSDLLAEPSEAGDRVYLINCRAGSTVVDYEYANALGTLTLDKTIKVTGTPADFSWRLQTTSLCGPGRPFVTPWLEWTDAPNSSITPRFEILRNGNASPWTDAEVGSEWAAPVTSDSPISTAYSDYARPGTTPATLANGAGLSAWEGESGTAWSGKVQSPSAMTPTRNTVRGRIIVTLPSVTSLYVDPLIRA
jgi:hypothetical protein